MCTTTVWWIISLKGFYFRMLFFEEAFLFNNKSPRPAALQKEIPTIKSWLPSHDQTFWHEHVIAHHLSQC